MTRDEAKEECKKMLPWYLESYHSINTRNNFHCLNPNHPDHNPSMSIDKGTHCKCFSCQAYYDIFDVVAIDTGLKPNSKELFDKVFQICGFNPDTLERTTRPAASFQIKRDPLDSIPDIDDSPKLDLTEAVLTAHEELKKNPEALQHYYQRGLTDETIERYKLGYLPDGHNTFLKGHEEHYTNSRKAYLYKYILPYQTNTGAYSYAITEITDRDQTDEANGKYRKINKGQIDLPAELFNERYVKANTPPVIFLCEGIYDALAVEQSGGKAIALVGIGEARLVALCKKYRPKTFFILSMDNPEYDKAKAGGTATERIKGKLDLLHIPYMERVPEGAKDFNEALTNNAEQFKQFIQKAERKALDIMNMNQTINAGFEVEEPIQKSEEEMKIESHRAENCIEDFWKVKDMNTKYPPISTGFQKFDKAIGGGLHNKFYVVGANTSLGKTSFVMQIADNIAAQGIDVLIFSLEMAKEDLIARSISRKTMTSKHPKTEDDIISGWKYANYTQEEREIIRQAEADYLSNEAKALYFYEGKQTADEIRKIADKHIKATNHRTVIIIDYLQLLQPAKHLENKSIREQVDYNIDVFVTMRREFFIPVIAISSFSRGNYNTVADVSSMKESGGIEYSGDAIITLELKYEKKGTANADRENYKEAIKQIPRKITLTLQKNRGANIGDTIDFEYDPRYSSFEETEPNNVKRI